MFQIIATEVPVVFLYFSYFSYFSDYLYAARQVQGLKIAPLTDPRDRLWNAEDWCDDRAPLNTCAEGGT